MHLQLDEIFRAATYKAERSTQKSSVFSPAPPFSVSKQPVHEQNKHRLAFAHLHVEQLADFSWFGHEVIPNEKC